MFAIECVPMEGKATYVTLSCGKLGLKREFPFETAERLLSFKGGNGGWTLSDIRFEYSDVKGLVRRRDTL